MIVDQIALRKFRNIEDEQISFSHGVNIICGDNAQGKTNIIEAIALFACGKSFRAVREKEMIEHDSQTSVLTMKYTRDGRGMSSQIKLHRKEKKECYINDIKLEKNSQLIGGLLCVLFAPEHLNLVKDGPQQRRQFLDMAISQISPKYFNAIAVYSKILKNRNALLKTLRKDSRQLATLDAWDEKMCEYGAFIIRKRLEYIDSLKSAAQAAHNQISDNTEKLDICYLSESVRGGCLIRDEMNRLMKNRREEDIFKAVSSVGPHRDDLSIMVNGLSARLYGSQGQQRSCVLSLKMAEADMIWQIEKESPVMLLDDVLSELDERRQSYLLNKITGMQVIITTCDSHLHIINEIKRLKICGGKVE